MGLNRDLVKFAGHHCKVAHPALAALAALAPSAIAAAPAAISGISSLLEKAKGPVVPSASKSTATMPDTKTPIPTSTEMSKPASFNKKLVKLAMSVANTGVPPQPLKPTGTTGQPPAGQPAIPPVTKTRASLAKENLKNLAQPAQQPAK